MVTVTMVTTDNNDFPDIRGFLAVAIDPYSDLNDVLRCCDACPSINTSLVYIVVVYPFYDMALA